MLWTRKKNVSNDNPGLAKGLNSFSTAFKEGAEAAQQWISTNKRTAIGIAVLTITGSILLALGLTGKLSGSSDDEDDSDEYKNDPNFDATK